MDGVASISAVLVGRAVPFGRPGARSAIVKREIEGPVAIGPLGLDGDEQSDLRHHGGPEKAVHLYSLDHYGVWRDELSASDAALGALAGPGAFGENLAVVGADERNICVGDVWRAGTALLQVSQGRQPCWKLDDRFGVRGMAQQIQTSLRTGWYCRVLRPGSLRAGDAMILEERPNPAWTLSRLLRLLYVKTLDQEGLEAVAALPELAQGWRSLAERRLARGEVEDWRARLEGA
ncbi:MOSC domain-containing protein [Roseomonas sp. WA12]